MLNREPSPALPPSGAWSGYYLYEFSPGKHRMRMSLAFSADGTISGDGIDDVGPFTIRGVFDCATNAASWTKAYIGMHSVEYRGLYDLRSICGTWTLVQFSGGFWIWPDGIGEEEALKVELELPVERFEPATAR